MSWETIVRDIIYVLFGLVFGWVIGSVFSLYRQVRKLWKQVDDIITSQIITSKILFKIGEAHTHEVDANNP